MIMLAKDLSVGDVVCVDLDGTSRWGSVIEVVDYDAKAVTVSLEFKASSFFNPHLTVENDMTFDLETELEVT